MNDTPRGPAPVSLSALEPGTYQVWAAKDGYEPQEKRVQVRPGRREPGLALTGRRSVAEQRRPRARRAPAVGTVSWCVFFSSRESASGVGRPPALRAGGPEVQGLNMEQQGQTIRFWCGRLPHWEVVDGRYFITLRLAGTLPKVLKKQLQGLVAEVRGAEGDNMNREYFRRMEAWLDKDRSSQILVNTDIAEIIMTAFAEYEARSIWSVHSYVIMPNHLHWFFTPLMYSMSESIMHFKRYTTRQVNAYMSTKGKRFWQKEWFDHWSRSASEDEKIVQYIRYNPVKAGLVRTPEQWPYLR